jgi:hypothetical protein
MKQITRNLCLILLSATIIVSRSLNSAKGTCSISTISIPVGSNSPVMVYNARIENESWRLTVLPKEQQQKLKVDGEMFFSDKETGDSWFSDKNIDEKQFESMRDAFSLCRTLNADNKETKVFEKSRLYSAYRTKALPSFVALRKESQKTASFLQVASEEILDDNLMKDLDELENDEGQDANDEQSNNNNDALSVNKELQDQLSNESEAANSISHEMILD